MFGLDLLVLIGQFALPFLIGMKVKSKKRGLIPILVLPALLLASGITLFISSGTYGHTDATVDDFAAVLTIAMGIYLGFVFVTCWLLGRWVRNRRQSKAIAAIGSRRFEEPFHASETERETGESSDSNMLPASISIAARSVPPCSTALDVHSVQRFQAGALPPSVR